MRIKYFLALRLVKGRVLISGRVVISNRGCELQHWSALQVAQACPRTWQAWAGQAGQASSKGGLRSGLLLRLFYSSISDCVAAEHPTSSTGQGR